MTAPSAPPDEALGALGAHIADALEPSISPSRLAAQRAALVSAVDRPRSAAIPGWRAVTVAVAAVVALGLGVTLRLRPVSPRVLSGLAAGRPVAAGQWLASPVAAPLELAFSDGSRVTLSPGTQLRVVELDARGARVMLERGHAEVHVVHRAGTAWRFAAGPYAVDVTGTAFGLGWDPAHGAFDLAMRQGRVMLHGPHCGDGMAVAGTESVHAGGAGEVLTLGAPAPSVPSAPGVPGVPGVPGPLANPAVTATVTAPSSTVAAARSVGPRRAARVLAPAPTAPVAPVAPVAVGEALPAAQGWRELAREGRFRDAMASLDDGAFRAAVGATEPDDLLALADAARYAGMPFRARDALQAVRVRFPAAAGARRAAFVLGLLALDSPRVPLVAARWFTIYLDESPTGPLAAEAWGRLAQALDEAGDHDGARRAAGRYLEIEPDGAFAAAARALVGP